MSRKSRRGRCSLPSPAFVQLHAMLYCIVYCTSLWCTIVQLLCFPWSIVCRCIVLWGIQWVRGRDTKKTAVLCADVETSIWPHTGTHVSPNHPISYVTIHKKTSKIWKMCKKIGNKGLLHQPHHKTMDIGEIVKHIILDLVKNIYIFVSCIFWYVMYRTSLYHVYICMSWKWKWNVPELHSCEYDISYMWFVT